MGAHRPASGAWRTPLRVLLARLDGRHDGRRGRRAAMRDFAVVTTPGDQARRRAAPELRVDTATGAPGGELAALAVPNARLRPAMVPSRGAPWEVVQQFALTYDGRAYWNDVAVLGSRGLQVWARHGSVYRSLDELRGCLFHEQRRWHHFGEEPVGRSAEYVWALLDAIRQRVGAEANGTSHPAGGSARHHGNP